MTIPKERLEIEQIQPSQSSQAQITQEMDQKM